VTDLKSAVGWLPDESWQALIRNGRTCYRTMTTPRFVTRKRQKHIHNGVRLEGMVKRVPTHKRARRERLASCDTPARGNTPGRPSRGVNVEVDHRTPVIPVASPWTAVSVQSRLTRVTGSGRNPVRSGRRRVGVRPRSGVPTTCATCMFVVSASALSRRTRLASAAMRRATIS
jgi:hypothetical protein